MSRRSSPSFGSLTGQAARDQRELVQSARAVLAGFQAELDRGELRSAQHAALRRLEAAIAAFDSADSTSVSLAELVGGFRNVPVMSSVS